MMIITKKVLCFFLVTLCFCSACATKNSSNLPPLIISCEIVRFDELKQKDYTHKPDGSWLFAVRLAEKFHEEGKKKLLDCTDLCYGLFLQDSQSYILPSSIDWEKKIALLEKRLQEAYFQKYKLTEKESKEIEQMYREAIRSEHYFLYSELIIAEIKQAFSMAMKKRKTKYRVKEIESLPEVSHISMKRNHTEVLKTLYRQLLVTNYHLPVPTWESLYEEDQKNNLLEVSH
ncbi:MAG: hypothetical protein HUU50_11625 [Candidatus Brocadiae bacterium]|nr:hypothetical protein [Candidatus Brocadiia bacterium]